MEQVLYPRIISINDIYQSIMNNNFEICGYAELSNGFWNLTIVNIGPPKVGNEPIACDTGVSYPVLWHTHPAVSKIYPSLVDIIKVIKHSTVKSFIFTHYGYWELSCPNKYTSVYGPPRGIPQNRWDVSNTDPVTLEINEFLTNFYNMTERGKVINNEAVSYLVNNLNQGINEGFGITGFLIEWKGMPPQGLFN